MEELRLYRLANVTVPNNQTSEGISLGIYRAHGERSSQAQSPEEFFAMRLIAVKFLAPVALR